MGAQRTPLRPTFSPARLGHVVYASASGGQMETILAWDSTSHGGIMPEGYLHLTYEQRCQIYALLQSGHSQAYVARQIGVDRSTISRELVRNTGARGYRFKQAHDKASRRRQEASDQPRKMTPDVVELIEEKLTQEQWSYVFCGRHLLDAKLRRASVDAADGAVEAVARIVAQIRRRWPHVRILVRADSGFARDDLMAWCEDNDVHFLLGLAKNERLVAMIADELAQAGAKRRRTGKPARMFKGFRWLVHQGWRRGSRGV